jgi:hypothetical protein
MQPPTWPLRDIREVSLTSTRIGFHFRTFQTNIILFIFFNLWTCSAWNAIQFDYLSSLELLHAYCSWVYARYMQILFWIEPWFSSRFSWNQFYMHNENQRFDDVFVIVFVLVRNLPIIGVNISFSLAKMLYGIDGPFVPFRQRNSNLGLYMRVALRIWEKWEKGKSNKNNIFF